MNIGGRKSIHSEEKNAKLDAGINTSNHRENRKIRSIVNDKTTLIGIERGDRSNADKTAVLHGSHEDLCEDELYEEEYSYSTSFKNKTVYKESLNLSPVLQRRNQNVSRLRTESPIRHKHVPPKKTEHVSYNKWPSGLLAIILSCLGIYFVSCRFILSGGSTRKEYTCSFNHLNKSYPIENSKLWKYLRVDIEDILNNRFDKPSVTLFIHKGNEISNELIRDIAKTASNCIDSSLEPIEFNNSDFTSDDAARDYGVIIEKYKKVTKEGNVVMIANLNEVPAEAARALHAICDRESPIFRKVVIFLSLTAEYNGERPIDIAEKALLKLWEGRIKENELGPLMARVTNEVILLESQ